MKLYDWLKVAPYQVDDQSAADDDDEFSASKGLRILAIAYSTERFFWSTESLKNNMFNTMCHRLTQWHCDGTRPPCVAQSVSLLKLD